MQYLLVSVLFENSTAMRKIAKDLMQTRRAASAPSLQRAIGGSDRDSESGQPLFTSASLGKTGW